MKHIKKFRFLFTLALLSLSSYANAELPVGNNAGPLGSGNNPIELPNPLGVSNINDLLGKIIDGLIVFATPVAAAMIIWAAYLFISSGGDPKKITTAREALLWTVVGYAILLLAKGIGLIIQNFLGV